MNLIIVAAIVKPPTETLPLRFLTMTCKHDLKFSFLVDVYRKNQDSYYKYMRKTGLMDFVEELIDPNNREEGVRIDSSLIYPKTILTRKITFENVINILGQVKYLSSL